MWRSVYSTVNLESSRLNPQSPRNSCNGIPSVDYSVAMAGNVANEHTQGEGKELLTHFDSISNWFKYNLQPKHYHYGPQEGCLVKIFTFTGFFTTGKITPSCLVYGWREENLN